MIRARRKAALVSIPDRGLIIIGGNSASEAPAWMDSVEFLSMHALQEGWRNIAPLLQPIASPGAAYFHDVVIVAGGQGARGAPLATVYALKPPRLSVINTMGDREFLGSAQWTKLSTELPCPTWFSSICRVGEELFAFGEFDIYCTSLALLRLSFFHVDYGSCEAFKFSHNEELEITKVSEKNTRSCSCLLPRTFSLQPNECFGGWIWESLGYLHKVGISWSGTTAHCPY